VPEGPSLQVAQPTEQFDEQELPNLPVGHESQTPVPVRPSTQAVAQATGQLLLHAAPNLLAIHERHTPVPEMPLLQVAQFDEQLSVQEAP